MELNDGYLTIQAVRSHSNDEKDKDGHYLRRETFSGTCARSFYVGEGVKKEDIHAKFEDGILHIVLPAPQQQKALPANPNLIEIE
jgi:HSP20 family molecular chaperone IbpA